MKTKYLFVYQERKVDIERLRSRKISGEAKKDHFFHTFRIIQCHTHKTATKIIDENK